MSGSQTSPIIMVLITLAAAVTLLAWVLSSRTSRWNRALIAHLQKTRATEWRSVPCLTRTVNPQGVVERFRRPGQSVDPEFTILYQACRRTVRAETACIAVAAANIAATVIGTNYWG